MAVQHASALGDRLFARRAEIESSLLARVYGIADPTQVEDSEYIEGFRAAAAAAVDFALGILESPAGQGPPIPPVFLSQAALAAHNGVRLDLVLRRYAAGHALLADFLIQEVDHLANVSPAEFRDFLVASSAAFDRLLEGVGNEYAREVARTSEVSPDRARVELVERLLAGEPLGSDTLGYDLAGWHLGLVLCGSGAKGPLQELARAVDCRLLAVESHADTIWAWLGGRRRISGTEVVRGLRRWPSDVKVAVGESGLGVSGWRLSHQQARAVLSMAEGEPVAVARYADNALLASVRKDQILVKSLRSLYLDPLNDDREGGTVLRQTLRAYFEADCNVTSAASALSVHRQTVTSRLHTVEERIGRPISRCALDLNVALRLTS
jgi:hypothetical protein